MTRVLVFGARGWLGSRYVADLNSRVGYQAIGVHDVDIRFRERIVCAVQNIRPDVVINAAGRTHSKEIPNIDACVASPDARHHAFDVNATGAGYVAEACAAHRIPLVHLSSGCIFNGYDQLFSEQDDANPVSWYAVTKLMGERLIEHAHPKALILRIRMPISAQPHPRNLVTKLASARQIVDVVNSVTVVEDLLGWTVQLLEHGVQGIVHAVHPQPIAFRTLLRWYRELVDPAHVCEWIPPHRYPTKDGRSNCVLSTRELPIRFEETEIAVRRALQAYAHALVMST